MIGPDLHFTPRGLYIGGQWQEAADGGRLETINPPTGERLGEVPLATEADIDRAVRAGRKAFESDWGRLPTRERAGYLERLADRLHEHRDELGGKNPMIVFPDADPAKAAKAAVKGMNMNRQGQSCSSTSRVFVHESLHQDMLASANGVDYGLTASLITGDLKMAMETAERLEAGYVWINSSGRYTYARLVCLASAGDCGSSGH